ncbi:MAG: DUF192 domain-containing protein [Patescibacteria group bacterium]|jgi:uncharacterized membrane protein (UPF0127 family)
MKNKYPIFGLIAVLVVLGTGSVAYYYGWIQFPSDPYTTQCDRVSDSRTIRFPNGKTISASIADDEPSRAQGLSGVSGTSANNSMLFIFDAAGTQSMWMKDMLFDLDMIWLDPDYRIVHLEKGIKAPGSAMSNDQLKIYQNTTPARYVLEVTAGLSETNHLTVGDKLETFPTEQCVSY